ncbi:MAG: glycosyl transferase, group 1 [Cyanobacteria bacterium RYN_339]|nr:glycosyl transferase, group 1 [Cyanobacteria bacterium RYN_339]
MRIGFDARLWHHTGIGRYLHNLLAELADADWTIWVAPADVAAARAAWPAARIEPCPAPVFSLREQIFWARTLPKAGLDLFHAPHLNIPLACPVPLVVTLHDLIPLRFPGTHNSGLGTLYFGLMARLAVRRARRVIAVSEHTRKDLVALLQADPARIDVVLQGADLRFAAPQPRRERGRYVLYAGQWKRYKNVETLITAFARLPADVRLVLAGRVDPHAVHVPALIQRLGLAPRIELPGYLPEADLVALFQGASLFAFPSRYEGFGLPPLEAMAAGVPVVCSDAASLPEVVGDAAVKVAPDDVDGWARAMQAVLDEPALRDRLVQAGHARVAALPWSLTARRTAEVYRSALVELRGVT